jgi:phosphoribosylglycinamide formyltransferase-1
VTVIGAMASGRGSNLQAIMDSVESGHIPDSKISLVISDKADAKALTRAKEKGIEALHIDPNDFSSREEFDIKVADEMEAHGVELILLAGYMRIVSDELIKRFTNRIMNIHPALLPSFPGLTAQKDALEYGVKISGCTVHFVDEKVDHGPIILQAQVEVRDDDTVDTLSARILKEEHKIYPKAVKLFSEGKLKVEGRKVKVAGTL